jgi:hypothetical protein
MHLLSDLQAWLLPNIYIWGFHLCRIWCNNNGYLTTNISRKHSVFLLKSSYAYEECKMPWFMDLQTLEDEDTKLPPNVWFQLPTEMASYPWRMDSLATPWWKSCKSHTLNFFSNTLNATAILNCLAVHKIIFYGLYILCMLQSALIKKNANLKKYMNILQWTDSSIQKN